MPTASTGVATMVDLAVSSERLADAGPRKRTRRRRGSSQQRALSMTTRSAFGRLQ
jgi:hypothetical protein